MRNLRNQKKFERVVAWVLLGFVFICCLMVAPSI